MSTESRSGLFANAEMMGFMGSSVLSQKLYRDIETPIGYGLSRLSPNAAFQGAQNRYMFGTQLWKHYNAPWYASGKTRYGSINSAPNVFEGIVRGGDKYKSLGETRAASFLNKATTAQRRYYSSRSSEAIRRLAAKKIVTKSGKTRAAGYFNRSIWKMTANKPFARRALMKAGVGQFAKGAFKLMSAGWQAGLLYEIGSASVKMLRQQAREAKTMNWGKGFEMTEGMYTERQRAVQAITSSRMSTRAAIGGEAQLLHR